MEKHINYEDNAFIINTRIRLLNDMLLLEVDPSLFFQKTLDDIDFINTTLEALLNNLLANDKLIERDEQLHILLETEWYFSTVLHFLIDGQSSLAASFYPKLARKLESIGADSTRRQGVIREKEAVDSTPADTRRMVSTLELAELLKE